MARFWRRRRGPTQSVQALLSLYGGTLEAPAEQLFAGVEACAADDGRDTATAKPQTAPEGMVRIPDGDYEFQVSGIEIEGGNDPGVDVQYPWEDAPRRFHRHRMHIHSFYIDRTPVTNAEFAKICELDALSPEETIITSCVTGRTALFPHGWENKPVTWVSIEDARAYAAWSHKRLPHEWEWQYAAQSAEWSCVSVGERLGFSGASRGGFGADDGSTG